VNNPNKEPQRTSFFFPEKKKKELFVDKKLEIQNEGVFFFLTLPVVMIVTCPTESDGQGYEQR
jgi:hypothetical protein